MPVKSILLRAAGCALFAALAACGESNSETTTSSVDTASTSGDVVKLSATAYRTVAAYFTASSGQVSWSDRDRSPRRGGGTSSSSSSSGSSSSSSSSSSGGSSSSGSSGSGSTTKSSSSSSSSSSGGILSVAVSGTHFVDASGSTIQIRGVNASGLEFGSVQGAAHPWDYSNLTTQSGALPNFAAIAGWKANAVRLPLNEASWLGLTVTYNDGSTASADPSGDYQATVIASVKAANAAGLYVILDLHWNAPGNFAPVTQNPFMDSDHSLDFWTSIANAFKDNPAVLFELFNEPYLHPASSDGDGVFPDNQNWNQAIRNGGITAMYYRSLNGRTSGSQVNEGYSWTVVGYQAALNAIRATGATNVVIMGGQGYDNDETWWTQYPPSDPLQQIALNYHAYESGWGYDPTGNSAEYTAAQSIAVLAGPKVPVIFTEMGAAVGNGVSTTYMTELTQLLDGEAWSGMAWTWNPWGGSNTLIQNITSYTPTPGEGTTYYAWTFNHK